MLNGTLRIMNVHEQTHPHSPYRGLALLAVLGVAATLAVDNFGLARFGISALTLAIVAGAVLGNSCAALARTTGPWHPGVRFAQRHLLRAGVALYGFNLSLQQIATVGSHGIWIDILMVASTIGLGWFVGTRVLGLDRETTLLTAAGSAICGAAAVVATAPVLKMDAQREADSTAAAVATVILYGTAAIFIYPLLHAWLFTGQAGFGTYIGSTVHEVAQVVAIGNLLGDDTERAAVIVKMIRVILLVPFLLAVGGLFRTRGESTGGRVHKLAIPWFALIFIAFAGINSLHWLPESLVAALRLLGIFCLTLAMAALGIDTNLSRLRQSGPRVFALGLVLFLHLIVTGGLLNFLAARA